MDLSKLTVKQIRDWAKQQNIKPPSGLVKDDLIRYLTGYLLEQSQGILNDPKLQKIKYADLVPTLADPNIDWLVHLHTEGWAVVPIENWNPQFEDIFLDWFASCSPNFNKHDINTWTPENLPVMAHNILKNYFGQTELQWQIRELTLPIFTRIWNCQPEDLLCSFDGGCLIPPKTIQPDDSFKHWIHVDQRYENTGFCNVQGIVNFRENGPTDGGLVLVHKSKDVFAEYMHKHPSYGLFWKVCDMSDPLLSNRPLLKICAPPGSIILFDSRMFHSNTPPINTDNYRMCTYVSMQPRSGATQKELDKRIKLYETGRMTGHWCYGKYFKETSEHPNTYGKPYNKPPQIEIAPLNDIRKKLVGY